MYATYTPEDGQPSIVRLSDQSFIPMSDENRDYRKFLRWVEEGNTPTVWTPDSTDDTAG